MDLETLQTLSEREFRAGLAEVIKHALIGWWRVFWSSSIMFT